MSHTEIVAELSANHRQQFDEAVKLIKAAKESGADAVKLQTYTPDTLTIRSSRAEFLINAGSPWDGKTLYDLYGEAYTPWEWQPKLKKVADEIGIELFSSPFDKTAVDFLEEMGVLRYKIASFEMIDLELVKYVASKGKPIIISTGMANLAEIKETVNTAMDAGATDITLLKCTSTYPANPEEMNLKTIPHLLLQFIAKRSMGLKLSVGFSDHTIGIVAPIVATTLGATMIEKHFTLSRNEPSPDSSFSLEPDEFKAMVEGVRMAEKMLGERTIGITKQELGSMAFRRSLFVVKDMKVGEVFIEDNMRSIRPGYGLEPRYFRDILGKKATKDIERGTPLSWELVN